MGSYCYSAKRNTFYPMLYLSDYIEDWPDDVIQVNDSIYDEFAANITPDGKYRIAGDNGLPTWADIPPPDPDALIEQAEEDKIRLLDAANLAIAPLERAVKLGIATSSEVEKLEGWEKYSVLVSRIDTSTAPDIEWPSKPL